MNTVSNGILIAPLDWGLGHASRCVPVIRALTLRHRTPLVAADGPLRAFFEEEMPGLTFVSLPAYDVRYARHTPFAFQMLKQYPRLRSVMQAEHEALRALVRTHGIRAVISDNRYGLHHPDTYNVLITHQLNIIPPPALRPFRNRINRTVRDLITRFDECWVPDEPDHLLSGELSRRVDISNLFFTGILSRLEPQPEISDQATDVVAVISGPEPQRSLFEKIIIRQLVSEGYRAVVFSGCPGLREEMSTGNVTIRPHAPAAEMSRIMMSARLIVCRPGYSTLMDLLRLRRNALLIPTPGQTEQEYLAGRLQKQGLFMMVRQKDLSLSGAIGKALTYPGFSRHTESRGLLDACVERLLRRTQEKKGSDAPLF